jgi:hypothetical protein
MMCTLWSIIHCRHIVEAQKDGLHNSLVAQYSMSKAKYFSTVFEYLVMEAVRLASGDVRADAHDTISVFRTGGKACIRLLVAPISSAILLAR